MGEQEWQALLSEPELEAWGMRIGREVELPAVLALRGDLGAGKSTLARAIARGAGVSGPIPSPTFNLLFEYPAARGGRVPHFDLFRLEEPEEVWELGWEELAAGPELVLIEWPERAEALLPVPRWDIFLKASDDPLHRWVEGRPVGDPPLLPPMPGAACGVRRAVEVPGDCL